MATEVVKIVDPDNGTGTDYTSLSAWEAGEQRDLVTADEIAVATCRCTSGSADTTAVTIDGWTTDSTRYIKIWTDPTESYRHDGKWNTSAYRLEPGNATGIDIVEDFVKIIGLQIYVNPTSLELSCIISDSSSSSAEHTISHCILRCNGSASNGAGAIFGWYNKYGTIKAYNNIGYDLLTGYKCGGIINNGSSIDVYSYNNTMIGGDYGFGQFYSTTFAVKNCLAQSCTDGFYGTFDSASDYNCSDISGDAPGSNSVTGNVTFVDATNDDYHLDSSDTVAKDAGTDLSSDPNLSFSDDIDGETRSGVWDIGADEYVAAGGTTYDVALSLSQGMAASMSSQATAEGAVSLQASHALSDGGQAGAQGSVLVDAIRALLSSAQAMAEGQMALPHSAAITIESTAAGEAALSLAKALALALGSEVAGTEGFIELARAMGLNVAADALAEAALSVAHSLAVTFIGEHSAEAALTLAISKGLTCTYIVMQEVSMSLAQSLGLTASGQAAAEAQLNISQLLAISVLATALAEAGVGLAQIRSLAMSGTSVIADLVTPDNRTYTVTVEVRTMTINSEDRTLTIN